MCAQVQRPRHAQARDILARLQREGIYNLYHFTNVQNLPSIASHGGLFSKQTLECLGKWPCEKPGGNTLSHNLDKQNDNWDKIGLNLTAHTPMFYTLKSKNHFCFCVVSLEVATWADTFFTDTNAAAFGHKRGQGLVGLNNIDFDMVRTLLPSDPNWRKLVQAEVLVKDKIPIELIEEIGFISEASMLEGRRLWGRYNHPPFKIDKSLFADYPEQTDRLCGLPYISKVTLTDMHVSKANYRTVTSKTRFRKNAETVITAVIKLESLVGTTAKVVWGNGIESVYQFDTWNTRTWWPSTSLRDLPVGINTLRITLDDVLWATANFEVFT